MSDPGQDVERVLVVTAHPDDVDFSAAGSIASWTDAGIDVSVELPDRVANGNSLGVSKIALLSLPSPAST